MNYEEFIENLKKNNLSVVDFAKLSDTSKSTVYQWKKNGVPSYVKSWLQNYQYKAKFEKLKQIIKELD